jgi:hypothetical protein
VGLVGLSDGLGNEVWNFGNDEAVRRGWGGLKREGGHVMDGAVGAGDGWYLEELWRRESRDDKGYGDCTAIVRFYGV